MKRESLADGAQERHRRLMEILESGRIGADAVGAAIQAARRRPAGPALRWMHPAESPAGATWWERSAASPRHPAHVRPKWRHAGGFPQRRHPRRQSAASIAAMGEETWAEGVRDPGALPGRIPSGAEPPIATSGFPGASTTVASGPRKVGARRLTPMQDVDYDRGGEADRPVRGERALWRAVILQALTDAGSESRKYEARLDRGKARRWLLAGSRDFAIVCEHAGYEPGLMLRHVRRALAGGCQWRLAPAVESTAFQRR